VDEGASEREGQFEKWLSGSGVYRCHWTSPNTLLIEYGRWR
jgi:hypothetical protein